VFVSHLIFARPCRFSIERGANIVPIDLMHEYRLALADRQAIRNPALEIGHNSLLLEISQNGARPQSGSKTVQKFVLSCTTSAI
jgi:hypothetical protein